MIVKNESKVIERCLNSVKTIIDSWVIVDTGSTDETPKIIETCLKDVPGQLYQRPWVDFAHNRNEALKLAQKTSDYVFFIDADEELSIANEFVMPLLDKDAYYVATILPDNVQFYRMLLVNNHLDWQWEGVIHEALYSPCHGRSCAILPGIQNIAIAKDGHRSKDPEIFKKDVRILEGALKKEPHNSRYVFFLAQSYLQSHEYKKALQSYEKRSKMSGFDEEIYYSYYMMGLLQEKLEMAPEVFLKSYQKAFETRPSRAEPLYRMGLFYHRTKQDALAYPLLKRALELPLPNTDSINVERDIYLSKLAQLFYECHLG